MDSQRLRRLCWSGLLLGAGLAGVSARYRSRIERSPDEGTIITERHATAVLVSRRIDPGHVETIKNEVSRTCLGVDPNRVLGFEEASTASLFINRSEATPELVWYVELPRAVVDEWDDPRSTVASAFPVDHDALEPVDHPDERTLLVHAVHPGRPRTTDPGQNRTGRSLEDSAASTQPAVDVELVRMRLKPGLPERLADWFERLTQQVISGERTLDRLESWSAEMLEQERMYTESIVLDRRNGYTLYQYMEADEMQQVYDAYYDTWNPVARVAEHLMGRLLENPACILEYPLETEFELLAHAIDPDRPRRVGDCLETENRQKR
ncbi:DUF6176 family protein [Natronorubrum thiooxidans]|uniref:Uncharacterized protein n=1 Tax=Natronorubrum thiooxidans TaxID=308853 RepID=A0A1N7CI13_9EURY|nr:DUF6176 family protein [Natronorubrum thiooxidans]SIR63246.1 hypothetical protein SAMN05421752_101379 [Natronorubrum thiooxidans]